MPDFGWEGDVSDAEDEDDDENAEQVEDDVSEQVIPEWKQTDDVDELKEMWLKAPEGSDKRDGVRKRLHELDAAVPSAEEKDQQSTLDSSSTATGDSSPDDESTPSDGSDGDVSGSSDPDSGIDQTGGETAQKESKAPDDDDDPFADLDIGGMGKTEAEERDHRKRVIVWGPPGVGKTHNAYTADPPLAFIDTEGKAHDLLGRFDLDDREVRFWQPSGFPEAQEALEEALEWLGVWHEEYGRRGTIIVDSMSMVWEWAKSHYIHKYYIEPDATGKYEKESDVDLKSSLQSNDADWPRIKEYHNDGFRAKILDSPFHFVWTQMAVEDFEEKIGKELSVAPDKPHGERDNPFKANYIIHIREDSNGVPHADLEKSGTTQHTFAGLEWPTLPDVFDVLDDIREAETTSGAVRNVTEYDVDIIKGKPSRMRGVEE